MTEDEANRDFRVVLLNEAKIVCYPFCNITGWRCCHCNDRDDVFETNTHIERLRNSVGIEVESETDEGV